MVSTAGRRRWLSPPEYMYPIERATESGLVGPWRTPDIGQLPPGLNPVGIEPWGISNFYLLLSGFSPARLVRERIQHEVASVVLKEFALQDAGMLGGTQAALEYGIVDEFPLNDQEILVRHLHKVVVDWVAEYQAYRRQTAPAGV